MPVNKLTIINNLVHTLTHAPRKEQNQKRRKSRQPNTKPRRLPICSTHFYPHQRHRPVLQLNRPAHASHLAAPSSLIGSHALLQLPQPTVKSPNQFADLIIQVSAGLLQFLAFGAVLRLEGSTVPRAGPVNLAVRVGVDHVEHCVRVSLRASLSDEVASLIGGSTYSSSWRTRRALRMPRGTRPPPAALC